MLETRRALCYDSSWRLRKNSNGEVRHRISIVSLPLSSFLSLIGNYPKSKIVHTIKTFKFQVRTHTMIMIKSNFADEFVVRIEVTLLSYVTALLSYVTAFYFSINTETCFFQITFKLTLDETTCRYSALLKHCRK